MKAAVCVAIGQPLQVLDVTLDPPQRDEVQVHIAAAGVCHSDYSVMTGVMPMRLPCVLGHEGAGVVEEVGPGVTHVRPGDRVVLSWVAQCGSCYYCRAGQPHLCALGGKINQNFRQPDGSTRLRHQGMELQSFSALGALAERVVAPAQAVVKVPDDAPLTSAALLGCAVMTGFGAVTNTAAVAPGSAVAVFGVGGVGLNVVQASALAGAALVIAVDMSPARLAHARTLGATHTLEASSPDVAGAIRGLTEGRGADYTFDAAGRKDSVETAYAATRRGGTCVVIGIGSKKENVEVNAYFLPVLAKRLLGCWYGGADVQRDLPRLLEMNRSGRLKLDELVGRTYGLDDVNRAFGDLASGTAGRGLVVF